MTMKTNKQKRGKKDVREAAGFSMTDEVFAVSIGQLVGKEEFPTKSPQETVCCPVENNPSSKPAGSEMNVASFVQVTLHRESAGRGGKTVTLVAVKPPQTKNSLEALAKDLRRGLGCGSHVEGDRVVLQGDIPDRAQEWFVKKGARKIVRGN